MRVLPDGKHATSARSAPPSFTSSHVSIFLLPNHLSSLHHHWYVAHHRLFKREMSADFKRRPDDLSSIVAFAPKKARNQVATYTETDGALQEAKVARTSNLQSPIMQLTGHQGEILSCKFHPNGEVIASAGHDRQLYLWSTYGECENLAALYGHKAAILEVAFSFDGGNIYTASADKTINMWDTQSYTRIKKLKGHTDVVNGVCCARKSHLMASGSDDCTVRVWDTRIRQIIHSHKDSYQILSVTFNENADQVVYGGIDNFVKVYDIRKNDVCLEMGGHFDSITGLALSPESSLVLSNSMNNTLCIWDIKPFAASDRCIKTLHGHQHNFEKNLLRCSWSPDGSKVTAGSSDRFVNIWDTVTKKLIYKLPGHQGCVNEVVFHPSESIILSCSSDKHLFLGELDVE